MFSITHAVHQIPGARWTLSVPETTPVCILYNITYHRITVQIKILSSNLGDSRVVVMGAYCNWGGQTSWDRSGSRKKLHSWYFGHISRSLYWKLTAVTEVELEEDANISLQAVWKNHRPKPNKYQTKPIEQYFSEISPLAFCVLVCFYCHTCLFKFPVLQPTPSCQPSIRLEHHRRGKTIPLISYVYRKGISLYTVSFTGKVIWNYFNSFVLLIPSSVFLVANRVSLRRFIRREVKW